MTRPSAEWRRVLDARMSVEALSSRWPGYRTPPWSWCRCGQPLPAVVEPITGNLEVVAIDCPSCGYREPVVCGIVQVVPSFYKEPIKGEGWFAEALREQREFYLRNPPPSWLESLPRTGEYLNCKCGQRMLAVMPLTDGPYEVVALECPCRDLILPVDSGVLPQEAAALLPGAKMTERRNSGFWATIRRVLLAAGALIRIGP